MLYVRPGVEGRVLPLREGGTGNKAERPEMPTSMPERFEAGTMNIIGLYGLNAALDYVFKRGIAALRAHEETFIRRVLKDCAPNGGRLKAFTLLGPTKVEARTAVFSFTHPALSPTDLAAMLESRFGILTRAGLACAPRALSLGGPVVPTGSGLHQNPPSTNSQAIPPHPDFMRTNTQPPPQSAMTAPTAPLQQGAMRVSFGPFQTETDVDRVITAMEVIALTAA